MRRRDTAVLTAVLAALTTASCGIGSHNARGGKVKPVEQVAPRYAFNDDDASRKRLAQQERLGLALNRLRAGDLVDAEKYARAMLKHDPRSVDGHTVLATIQSEQGNTAAAGASYRSAAELAPQRGDVLNNYGAWLCASGDFAQSLYWFDRAVTDAGYGDAAEALANAGECALQAGQRERALRDLRSALELDPANRYALESMARSEYGNGRYLEARAFSERRLAAASANASVLQLAIQIEKGLGDKVAASRYQQRLIKEFPVTATAHPKANAL